MKFVNLFMEIKMFCVYLTVYKGNKLPPFYIGSSSVRNIQKGYIGSVGSIEYRDVWLSESKANPDLFEIKIISTHKTRLDAYRKEQKIQRLLNVVDCCLYVNKSYALERMDNTGKVLNSIWRKNLSLSTKGKPKSDLTKLRMRKPKTEEHNKKVSEAKLNMVPVECSFCKKQGNKAVMYRFHFNNCKLNPDRIVKENILIICPHCNKQSYSKSNMTRFHFDNCKKKGDRSLLS